MTRARPSSLPRLAVVCFVAIGCDPGRPASESVIAAAEKTRALEVASATAAAAGTVPYGAAPELLEGAFRAERPTAFCAPSESHACSLDSIDWVDAEDENRVRRFALVRFLGWAADDVSGTVPPVAFLELDGPEGREDYFLRVQRMTDRPDVVRALKSAIMMGSGYDALGSLEHVVPGEYRVRVLQIAASGAALTCDTRRKLLVE